MVPLKDELLSRLAAEANVGPVHQLRSGPGPPATPRLGAGPPPGHRFAGPATAVEALLAAAPAGSVNVRSFRAGAAKGGPFTYGLTRRDDALAVLRSGAGDGLHTIANETADVDDGGVSGVAPFSFGRSTDGGEPWLRICPAEPVPGRFLTRRGWPDPFALLVEGVEGFGDDFMLARAAPAPLPARVTDEVRRLGARAAALGPVRFEWAHDGDHAWVLQLHLATVAASVTTISPGTPARWHRFDPAQGLDRLRDLIANGPPGDGIELTGDVGVISHAGDRLRRATIPSRVSVPPLLVGMPGYSPVTGPRV